MPLTLLKAFALIAGPILCGLAFFLVEAPAEVPGVYFETERGIYAVPDYSRGRALSFPDVPAMAAVPQDESVLAFFIVGPEASALGANAMSAQVYWFVVNQADRQFRSEYVPLTTAVRHVNPLVHYVSFDTLAVWSERSAAFQYYDEVRARMPQFRDAIQLMVGFVISDPAEGTRRMYPVRVPLQRRPLLGRGTVPAP